MAAIEPKELTQTYSPGVVGGNVVRKKTQLALVKSGASKTVAARNGHARALPTVQTRSLPPTQAEEKEVAAFEAEASGLAAWWRTAQIARVLGTMSLYLFLNDYDIRAAFNRRTAERKLTDARTLGRRAYFKT